MPIKSEGSILANYDIQDIDDFLTFLLMVKQSLPAIQKEDVDGLRIVVQNIHFSRRKQEEEVYNLTQIRTFQRKCQAQRHSLFPAHCEVFTCKKQDKMQHFWEEYGANNYYIEGR